MNKNLRSKMASERYLLQQKVKTRRLFLNMTCQELSDKCGISASALQRYETGETKSLSFEKFFPLAAALEVPITYSLIFMMSNLVMRQL